MRFARLSAFLGTCLLAAAVTVVSSCTPRAPLPAAEQAANVAAFARAYGVVRYFYPGDVAQTIDWDRFAVYGVAQVRAQATPEDLARTLRHLFAPIAAGVQIAPDGDVFAPLDAGVGQVQVAWIRAGRGESLFAPQLTYVGLRTARPSPAAAKDPERYDTLKTLAAARAAEPGRAAEFALTRGLKARVPLSLPDAYAATAENAAAADALRKTLAALPAPSADDLDTRIADAVVAWNVPRHFYPYWREAGVDWDAQLQSLLVAAVTSSDRTSHLALLTDLVERMRDGHGTVIDVVPDPQTGVLPIDVAPLDGGWVVAASAIPDRIAAGDTIVRVNGIDVREAVGAAERRHSGSPQWKAKRAASQFRTGPGGKTVALRLAGAHGEYDATLTFDFSSPQPEIRRPAPITELASGIWYVDITRTEMTDIEPKLATLAAARATIFDLRGYPRDAGVGILHHLIDAPENARWVHMPVFIEPFDQALDFEHHGWDLMPQPPHIGGVRYVLFDAGAISYAESVLGYVTDLKLATTIGSASAGANGDISPFKLPSGARIYYTGAKVTRHDGIGQVHLLGIAPQIAVTQTAQAWRQGRDLALERALELARAATPSP